MQVKLRMNKKIAFVTAEYHKEITEKMLESALSKAKKLNLDVVESVFVPGVFDFPLIVKKLLEKKEIQGIVVLGCVIQGETAHDKLVSFISAEKISFLSLEFNKPVAFGVSGPRMTKETAVKRINSVSVHAVESVSKLIDLMEEL